MFKRISFAFIFGLKTLLHPAEVVFEMSLRFFKKRFINQFIHRLKEKHSLIGTQFFKDHVWGN
jgi:hypothetical protein